MSCQLSSSEKSLSTFDLTFPEASQRVTRKRGQRALKGSSMCSVICKKSENKELLSSSLPSMCFHRVCHKLAVTATRNMAARRICLRKVIWSSLIQVNEISRKPVPIISEKSSPLDQYSCVKLMYYFKRTFVNVAVSMHVQTRAGIQHSSWASDTLFSGPLL